MIGTAQRFQISTLCASYRYHFNGKEKTDEWTGNSGDSYDFGARMYDSRLGRWLSCDRFEKKYVQYSTYSYVGNNPIAFIDIQGDSIYFIMGGERLAASQEAIMKMPTGKEVWDKYANSSNTNVYIAVGTPPGGHGGGQTLSPPGVTVTDGKIDVDPATTGNFATVFNGVSADPNKSNYLILVAPPNALSNNNEDAFMVFTATLLHELVAHVDDQGHEKVGKLNFIVHSLPESATTGRQLAKELRSLENDPGFKAASKKYYDAVKKGTITDQRKDKLTPQGIPAKKEEKPAENKK
jgi:RHS repeat-associated protein